MTKYFLHLSICIISILFTKSIVLGAGNSESLKLVWSDEFSGPQTSVDSSKWFYQEGGWGWGNDEAQYYTSRSENSYIENGNLVIRSLKEFFKGNQYTSAKLVSKPSWKYGRFEINAKLPVGRGSWAAFWMLPRSLLSGSKPWPDCGEIDIMENVGFDSHRIHATIHTRDYNHMRKTQKTNSIEISNPSENFHTYAMEWNPNEIRFFIDGIQIFFFLKESTDPNKWPFDQDFHLILNNAIGGFWGGMQGIDDSSFPQKYLIDYVRVYQ